MLVININTFTIVSKKSILEKVLSFLKLPKLLSLLLWGIIMGEFKINTVTFYTVLYFIH
jgi:hypothetical protein